MCRYIVYGVIAACWGILATGNESVLPELNCRKVIVLLSIYIAIDLLQYVELVFGYYLLFWLNSDLKNSFCVYNLTDKIEKLSWFVFGVKLLYLFTLSVGLIAKLW